MCALVVAQSDELDPIDQIDITDITDVEPVNISGFDGIFSNGFSIYDFFTGLVVGSFGPIS